MANNNRIFYACQGVAIEPMGTAAGTYDANSMVHGVQSVGITTSFNLEQAFELGQIEIYENIEGTPDVEVTLEKVLDGYPLIYHMATKGVLGTEASGLAARSTQRCDMRLGIFDETFNNLAAGTEAAPVEVYNSGMFVSSISYSLPVDGNATESVTLVGNNKQWLTTGGGDTTAIDQNAVTTTPTGGGSGFDGDDSPLAIGVAGSPSGGVQRREDVMMNLSIFPTAIQGVAGSGVGNNYDASEKAPKAHLQSITVSTDFSREDILELGRKTPYFRPANFPIEVTCEIEAITTSGDFVFAYEFGDPALHGTTSSGNNTPNENIFIQLRADYAFDLGSKNRLSSVSYGGGDAGGGSATCTYSYSNFNDLDVQASGGAIPDGVENGYLGFEFLKNNPN